MPKGKKVKLSKFRNGAPLYILAYLDEDHNGELFVDSFPLGSDGKVRSFTKVGDARRSQNYFPGSVVVQVNRYKVDLNSVEEDLLKRYIEEQDEGKWKGSGNFRGEGSKDRWREAKGIRKQPNEFGREEFFKAWRPTIKEEDE